MAGYGLSGDEGVRTCSPAHQRGSTIVEMKDIDIPADEVQLWWASLVVSDSKIDRLRRLLTPEELQRAERFRVAAAARRFIAARATLRRVLGQATGVAAADVEFRFGPHGKPRLADGGPCFNASDSGDFVVVALASAEVGVDIELLRPLVRRDRLARRICTNGELEALKRVPEEERDVLLLRLWTCKEAALKAIGTGLPGGVRNVEVSLHPDGLLRLRRMRGRDEDWSLMPAVISPEVVCTVAMRGAGWRLRVSPFTALAPTR